MRIGTIHMTSWPDERTQGQVIHDFVDSVVRAEELGLWSAWTTEHHLSNDPELRRADGQTDSGLRAYDLAADPMTILAYAAAKTSRIRLGTGVIVAHYDHPIRIAEQTATLDLLSGGRLEVGIGRGGSQGWREPLIFGVPTDPQQNQRRLLETLEVILGAWTGEPYSYEGEFYKIPEGVIVPSPNQKARPHMMVGTMSPDLLRWAAQKGIGYCSAGLAWGYANVPAIMEVDRVHREATAAAGIDHAQVLCPHILTLYCGTDDQEAVETAEEYLIKFMQVAAAHGNKNPGSSSGLPQDAPAAAVPANDPMADLRARANAVIESQIIGSPRTCIEKLEAFAQKIDLNYVLALVDYGGLPHQKSVASMERFAREVAPHFSATPTAGRGR